MGSDKRNGHLDSIRSVMIYVIDLLDEIRQRLDDTGGNLDPITTGITPFAAWQRAEVESSLVWNNSYLCRCLNWAIREIAVRTGGIRDSASTSSVCTINVLANQRAYSVNPLILTIEDVRRSDGYRLRKTTVNRLTQQNLCTDWTIVSGMPEEYFEDGQANRLTLYPSPIMSDTLLLTVQRVYQDAIVWNDDLALEGPFLEDLTITFLEIPDGFRSALIAGTCSQAWLRRDADANNAILAKQALDEFTQLAGPAVDARILEARRLNANLPLYYRASRVDTTCLGISYF